MDNDPGMSLFEFENPTYGDINDLEPEELEALEDEKRQDEQVREMMLTAFDDLEDSNSAENSYCDSSTNYESDIQKHANDRKHLSNESPIGIPNSSPRFKSPGYDNYQQLQVLYQVRLREIDLLRSNLENFKETSNNEKAHLCKRIDRLEAEKQKALSIAESLKLTKDNTTTDLREKVSKLESDLEERVKECDNLKKSYNEVCVTKDSLLKNNFLIGRELADLKKEKNKMKELIRNLTTEKDQLAGKLKTLQSELDNQKKELETLVTKHEDELRKASEKHIHELDSLKFSLNNKFEDSLLKNNFLIERELSGLRKEKNKIEVNELIRNLTSEKDQLAEKLKTLQSELDNQKKELETLVTKHKDELQKASEKHIHELDSLKLSLKNKFEDSLLKNNFLIERELADLRKEKNKMNELMKNLTSEKEQLAEKLKTLQSELDNQKKERETLVSNHEDELRKASEKHIHELDSLKLSLKNEFSKVEVFHQDQLSKLELEYAKKMLEMESSHKTQLLQIESNVKEEAVRICSEEIQMLSDSYKKQYDELILRALDLEHRLQEKTANYDSLKKEMDELKFSQEGEERSELRRLRTDLKNIETKYNSALAEWNEKLEHSNDRCERLGFECEKVYKKYTKARQAAKTLKERLDESNRLFREKHAQYMQTMNDILHRLNEVLNFKSAETKTVLDDLINGDVLSPSEEFNSILCGINQKLLLLKNKPGHEFMGS